MIVDDDQGTPLYADTGGAAGLLEQAGLAGARDRIYDWKRRGLLSPHLVVGRCPVYRMVDVWAVERDTRRAATRPRRLTSDW